MDRRLRWVLVVPVLVVSAYVLFSDTGWMGGWASTVDRVTGSTVLTGPLLASLAAGIQLSVVRMRPISEAARRGWRIPYRSALEGWVIGVAAYAVTVVVALGCTLATPYGGPAQWWTLLAGVLVLALASMVGVCAVHLLPSPLTVVAAGPGLFLLGAFGPPPVPELLRFGPTGSMTGAQVIPSVYFARFAAVAAACLCVGVAMAAWHERQRRIRLLAAAGVAAVAATAATTGVFVTATGIGDSRLEASSERPTACANGTPTVCVMPSHRRYLDRVRRSVDEAAPVLTEGGVDLPDRYEESFAGGMVSTGSGTFYLDEDVDETTFRSDVQLLVRPAQCPQWSSDVGPPYAAWDAEQLIMEWAVARAGGTAEAFNQEMDQWLDHIDDEATTSWVVETFELLSSCDFDRIVLPWE